MTTEHGERSDPLRIPTDGVVIDALLEAPPAPRGMVVIASTSTRPSDLVDARALRARRFATLVVDLLADVERGDPRRMLDVFLLARRLGAATDAGGRYDGMRDLPIGYLGVGTAAAGALLASVDDGRVGAVVCRGRPDLAEGMLERVTVPTLLLADRMDAAGLLNRAALATLRCPKRLIARAISPEAMARCVSSWFDRHLGDGPATTTSARSQRHDPVPAHAARPWRIRASLRTA